MKSTSGATSGSAASLSIVVPPLLVIEPPPVVAEKRWGTEGDEALKKRSRVVTFGQLAGATGSSMKVLAEKGRSRQRPRFKSVVTLFGNYMVCVQHERITALRVANKELQFGVRQEAVSTVEQWVKELQATVDMLRAELESSERRLKVLEQEVNTTHTSL
ncbi:hypothetical protein BHM03_00045113 [Ensete ventricosum]|nr:hypothetical protein BHM03_00045113 [Ensete ventricosum]